MRGVVSERRGLGEEGNQDEHGRLERADVLAHGRRRVCGEGRRGGRRAKGKPITRNAASFGGRKGDGGWLGAARGMARVNGEQRELAGRTRRAVSTSTHLSMSPVHRGLSGVLGEEECWPRVCGRARVCLAAIQRRSSKCERVSEARKKSEISQTTNRCGVDDSARACAGGNDSLTSVSLQAVFILTTRQRMKRESKCHRQGLAVSGGAPLPATAPHARTGCCRGCRIA